MTEPIRISSAARERRGDSERPTATAILAECRIRALKRLNAAFAALFDQLDDTLFELADKSDNNTDQNRYFDAMREVRLKRGDIETRFRDGCTRLFHEPASPRPAVEHAPRDGALTLSLVANDELEESLAIDNLVAKIEAECDHELDAFGQRVTALSAARRDDGTINPLAPRALCETFREACAVLEVGIEIKLILFKLFDRVVAATLNDCYHELNAYLVDQGILPVLRRAQSEAARPAHRRPTVRVPGAAPAPAGTSAGSGNGASPGGAWPAAGWSGGVGAGGVPGAGGGYAAPADGATVAGGFPALDGAGGGVATMRGFSAQDLLATLHQVMTVQGGRTLAEQGAAEADTAGTLRVLTQLQHGAGGGVLEGAALPPGILDPVVLAGGTTNVLRELRDGPVGNGIGHVDGMMIDIVAMLFDSILDDPAIPGPLKALIGRLQIPVLKVAILDKSFFARKFHPARELLNKLADVALGAPDDIDDDDPLYLAMHAIVHRVLDEFDDDVRMFKRAVHEVDAFRANEQRDAESRLAQSLQEVQAEERMRFARQVAAEQASRHTADPALTPIVREFLDVYWKTFLQLAYIDGGEEGEDWRAGIAVMDDLVWSLTPKTDAAERARLKAMLPELLARLRTSLERVSIPDDFRQRLTSTLVRLHLEAIRPGGAERPRALPAVDAPAVADADDDITPVAYRVDAVAVDEVADVGGEADFDMTAEFETTVDDAFFDLAGAGHVGEDTVDFVPDFPFDEIAVATVAAPAPAGEPVDDFAIAADDEAPVAVADVAEEPRYSAAETRLRAAIAEANLRILETAADRSECEGMGTTLVVTAFEAGEVIVAHVGDSRLYRLRDAGFDQITVDHSLRQELVNQGFYTPEEARASTRKNYITRAVGVDAVARPDTARHATAAGDVWLLCSDGLCDMVEDDDMAALLREHAGDLTGAAQALVDRANANGGKDNISVILAAIAGDGSVDMVTCSDVGVTRAHNEDCVACDVAAGLAVLADGMGGYNAGEVASELAVTTVMTILGGAPAAATAVDINALALGDGPIEIESITLEREDADAEDGAADAAASDDFPLLDVDAAANDDAVEEIEIHDVGAAAATAGDDEHLAAVRQLQVGHWVEFGAPGERCVRARLAWVSSATGCYLFCNRQGHKVVDTTPQGLAVEFRRGTARVLEAVPLFDRAVSSLMGRLHGATDGLSA
ncbi:MAG: DUF1631 family protein [Gammaproteobacteria bacterium]